MMTPDECKQRLKELRKMLAEASDSMKLEALRKELAEKTALSEREEVWSDLKRSQQLAREIASITARTTVFDRAEKAIDDTEEILMLAEEENDQGLLAEIEEDLRRAEETVEEMHLAALLKGKYDSANAILTLHAGAGGTEACDWVSLLYRMYMRYAERRGYKVFELDRLDGDEAGIKSVTLKVEGENAYGYLKAEKGVHRLVRISPFDANKRRHTSFASLEVMPEIEDNEEIKINAEDLRIDTYRSGGAGGQHINKTDSAVRITHLPTGIVVACQNERSQVQHREMAMKMLMSKLIEKRESERLEQEQSLKGEIKKIEWGSQIRSYVFCPYTLVKDHRTGFENSNVTAVMDGDIHPFIIDYLKKSQ